MMFSVMILEDNLESRKALETIIKGIAEDIHAFPASDFKEALKILESETYINLFILDINLNRSDSSDQSGFLYAKKIREDKRYIFTPIIFVTSVAELEAVSFRETYCYRFIVKPYNKEKIVSEVKKVMSYSSDSEEKYITIKVDGINYRIKVKDIIYIKAVQRGIEIVMRNETVQVKYTSIKSIMEQIASEEFIQCHRMYVINNNYVEYIDLVNQMIKMNGIDENIEIGVTYKNRIRSLMNE